MSILYIICFYALWGNSNFAQSNVNDSASLRSYQLESIIVSSNKILLPSEKSSTKIDVLNVKKIENSNGYSLSDILRNSGSAFVKSYGHAPQLQSVSMNGLSAEHTLILIDGVRLNSFQNSIFDLSLIQKDNIERIEILSNGASSLYGSNAMSSVINIIPKNGNNFVSDKILDYSLNYLIGSYNTNRIYFNLKKSLKTLSFTFNGSTETSDGNYDYFFQSGDDLLKKRRTNSKYKINDLNFSGQYIIGINQIIKIYSQYTFHDKEIPGIETGSPPTLSNQKDKNWNNIITYSNIVTDNSSLKVNFNFQNNYLHYSTLPILNSFYKNIIYSSSADYTFKNSVVTSTSGLSYTHALLKSNEVDSVAKRNQKSFYTAAQITLFDGVSFQPSLRNDYLDDLKKNILTYSVGLNYQPFENYRLNLRLNKGKNFRAPTFNDLHWKGSGNKNLRTEYSNNFETGISYIYTHSFFSKIDISYIHIEAKDKIVWIPQRNFLWRPENIAESISKVFSLTLSFEKEFNKIFGINTELIGKKFDSRKTSSQYVGDPSFNKQFPFLPSESINWNLGLSINHFFANLFFTWNSDRYSDYENKNKIEQFRIWDGNIGINTTLFSHSLSIRFELNNIFNENYAVISGYPMPLRNFRLSFSIKN